MSIFSIIDSFVKSLTPLCTFSLLWGPEQDWYTYSQRFAPHFPSQLPLGDRRHPTWVASLSSVLSKAIFIRFYGLDGMTIISQRSSSAPCWTGLLRSRQISGLQPSYHPNPLFYSIRQKVSWPIVFHDDQKSSADLFRLHDNSRELAGSEAVDVFEH